MLDIKYLREHPDEVAAACRAKGVRFDVVGLVQLDADLRNHRMVVEQGRAEKNKLSKEVPKAKPEERKSLLAQLKALDVKLSKDEGRLTEGEVKLHELLLEVPNLPKTDVPVSQDEADNVVLRAWGKKSKIAEPKDHVELGTELGVLDIDRATKLSGTRFAALTGLGARIELALVDLARETLEPEGFSLVLPPVLIKAEHMRAMGYLGGGGESETYHLQPDNLYLVGTAEQALGPMFAGETFTLEELPKRLLGYSPSFRREAGSYGKDTKGLIRVHQFDKVEMFAFTTPDESDAEHERFLKWQEKLVQALELPYRILNIISGDLGYPAARRYDIETWFPSQGRYRETHSTSTTTDYQTRRLSIRVKSEKGPVLAHAVNGTAFAIGRTVAALLENGQQPDGSVRLPRVLANRIGTDRLKPR